MLPEQCNRLRVTAKAAHFLGQLPQRSKLSYYFELHVSSYLSPYSISGYQGLSKRTFTYLQMNLMAHLKALCILRWNMGSDIKRHDVQKTVMVLIAVAADH
jgi:hypothetical protein